MSARALFSLPRPTAVCSYCSRRPLFEISERLAPLRTEQRRGKKKTVKIATIPVRLNKTLKGYGEAGSIVPVPRGQMRNILYPNGRASYVSATELKELGIARADLDKQSSMQKLKQKEPGAPPGLVPVTEVATPKATPILTSDSDPLSTLAESPATKQQEQTTSS